MTKLPLLLLAAAVAATMSCGGGAKSAGTSDSTASDTAPAPLPELPLPDTVMPSASVICATVRVIDTVTPAAIDSYDDLYAGAPGVLTFRGGPRRDAAMGGTVSGVPSRIDVDWTFTTTADHRETGFGQWGGGTGWTGQPLYVEWPDSLLRRYSSHLLSGFSGREIIVGSLAAKVYFIDFETGKASREPIDVGNPIKGTISLDPTLNGNLYVGQGVPAQRPFGALVIDLDSHRISDFYPEDPRAPRRWNAYDSSPVRVGRFIFRPGENGILYKFIPGDGKLKLHSTMSYTAGGVAPGMEASMSVYRNYGYTVDNHGYVVCTNLDTMTPVWAYCAGDDCDASPALAVEDGHPYIYVSSEIDRQGTGTARFAKLDGIDGTPVWESRLPGARFNSPGGKHFDGGFYASPLLGQGNCSHLLFSNFVRNISGQDGYFIAIDRATGATVYETRLSVYGWSSPVGFLNESGRQYVLTGDCGGNLYLIDGIDGTVITRCAVGSNFESSPVVSGNSAVVGSRGNSIYKVSIR